MLPKFPVLVSFDIANHPDTKAVWALEEARVLALLWKPCHIVDQHFWNDCLRAGKYIRKRNPQTASQLQRAIEHASTSNIQGIDLRAFCEEAMPYFTGTAVPFEFRPQAQA